jgi:prolyl-tRNA synthetase
MQDGKALQSGTSHFLGQNFAKAFDVKFATKEGNLDYVWATSWGVSTRLMGALVMAHGDNHGLILPPKLAPVQVVMVPIYKGDEELFKVVEQMQSIKKALEEKGVATKIDDRDHLRSGFKFAEWELKGVPVRIAIGPRDMEQATVELARRDTLEKSVVQQSELTKYVPALLDQIQQNIYNKALAFREAHTFRVDSYDEFKERIEEGGFFLCHWDGTADTEEKIKNETKATIRVIPFDQDGEKGACMVTGKPSSQRVIFARAY